MKIVFFIDDISDENGENEIHLEMEFFPLVGDTIILEGDGYSVTRRYTVVRNLKYDPMKATTFQYTAHLKSDK